MNEPDIRDMKPTARRGISQYAPFLVPVLGSILVAGLTVWVDHSVSERAEQERNARLATELVSRREQAESELRKDMFGTILRGFLESDRQSGQPEPLSERLLKLELLALNFGESLSLGPLFQEINRQIKAVEASGVPNSTAAGFERRIERLARRVADRQIAAVAVAQNHQATFKFNIPLAKVIEPESYWWPGQYVDETLRISPVDSTAEFDAAVRRLSCLSLDGVARRIDITLSDANVAMKTLRADVSIDTSRPKAGSSERCREAVLSCSDKVPAGCQVDISEAGFSIDFTLDRFNFPMIDNVLLSYNQRFAVVLRRFEPQSPESAGSVTLKGLLFPGEYASLRDKPQLDQAIGHLRDSLPDPD